MSATSPSSQRPTVNRQFTLAARPVGLPKESDFQLVESPLPSLTDGQILLRTLFLSVDPYMRSRISGISTYADPVNIGQGMVGGTVGQVIESKNPKFQVGEILRRLLGLAGVFHFSGRPASQARSAVPPRFPPRSAFSACPA